MFRLAVVSTPDVGNRCEKFLSGDIFHIPTQFISPTDTVANVVCRILPSLMFGAVELSQMRAEVHGDGVTDNVRILLWAHEFDYLVAQFLRFILLRSGRFPFFRRALAAAMRRSGHLFLQLIERSLYDDSDFAITHDSPPGGGSPPSSYYSHPP